MRTVTNGLTALVFQSFAEGTSILERQRSLEQTRIFVEESKQILGAVENTGREYFEHVKGPKFSRLQLSIALLVGCLSCLQRQN